MPDMNDISALLGLFSAASDSEKDGGQTENASSDGEKGGDGGFFGNIDADMLIKLMEVFSRLNEKDKNTDLILALKPHLKQENRMKADRAAELIKLMSVMTVLGDMNIF